MTCVTTDEPQGGTNLDDPVLGEAIGYTATDPLDLTAGLLSAYVSHNAVAAGDLPGLIKSVYGALVACGEEPEKPAKPLEPAVPIKKSVTPDAIYSLEDGKPYKMLKRHLASLGMTPDQYRKKWGLPADYPMTAPNYAALRSEKAKQIGLGRKKAA